MGKILVVEDSEEYRLTIQASLAPDHEIVFFNDAERIVQRVADLKPDLILMDIGLPETNGRDACRELQESAKTSQIPVLFVTGYKSPEDIAKGFQMGADDYVTKPFNPKELKARCEARMKKAREALSREVWVKCPPLNMNVVTRRAFCKGNHRDEREVSLTPAEFQLLLYLAKNSGRTVSRKEIEEELSSPGSKPPKTRVIDAQIKSIRKKVPEVAASILSVYGVGYRLNSNLE